LTAWAEPFDEATDGLKPIGTEKHDGEIACDAIVGRQIRRQGAHVRTVEPKPWQLWALNRPGMGDVTGTHVDCQHFSTRANLFGQVKGGDAMTGCDIKNPQTWTEVQMVK